MRTYREQILKYCFSLQREAQFSKSPRGMSSQSTHLVTTILPSFGTCFSPLGPPKNSCRLRCGAVLRFYENRCIKMLFLKNSSPRPWGAVFLQSRRPLQQSLTLVASLWWLKIHGFPLGFLIFLKIGKLPAAPSSSLQHPAPPSSSQ